MRSYQYHLQSTPVRENDRLSDGRCLAHLQKRPAGIFTAGREFDFLSKKLYAVLIPAYSFLFSQLLSQHHLALLLPEGNAVFQDRFHPAASQALGIFLFLDLGQGFGTGSF